VGGVAAGDAGWVVGAAIGTVVTKGSRIGLAATPETPVVISDDKA